ncbi:MAG: stage II sporulation protein M [Pseudomonadota bacterium]
MSASSQLADLLSQIGHRSAKALSREELLALPKLYRLAVAELAEARARGTPAAQRGTLEYLVIRAHAMLYAPAPLRIGSAIVDLVRAFPAAVRRYRRLVAIAALLLLVGSLWGYLEVARNPASAAVLLPGGLQENAEESFQSGASTREGHPAYGVFYFTNNARVAFNAYALGATFGVGTVLLLLFNGVILGGTIAVVGLVGSPRVLLSFVLPHGGIELAAIVIAAAGGLAIADGLLRPGWRRRMDSLRVAARESLPLVLGSAALLAVAGLVEGWISPQPLPLAVKAAIGGVLDVLLVVYLFHSRQ